MKNLFGMMYGVFLVAGVAGGVSAAAQMHKVEKPEVVVRAVGVYEWTGDMAKPTASRLIPVSLFIDGSLQDAGVYLARPVPFALLTGNVYELDQAGIAKGTLDLVFSRHLQAVDAKTGDAEYDDGWFGYGAFKAAPPARPGTALRKSKTLSTLTSNSGDTSKPQLSSKSSDNATPADPDRPTMKRRDDSSSGTTPSSASSTPASSTPAAATPAATTTASTASTASTPADDPDRPTMKRRTDDSASSTASGSTGTSDSSTASTASTASTPADDPDRPTMKRRSDDSTSGTSSGTDSGTNTASTGNVPADDPDRPTLKRRTPEEMKQARKDAGMSSVTGVGSLNDDPNRPRLHYGKPVGELTSADLPQLKGMPTVETKQMIAVSDAKDREPHDFSRPWEDDAERVAVLGKMEAMAREQLTAYEASTAAAAPVAPAKKAPVSKTARAKKAAAPVPPPPEPLLNEQLKGYTLSYGGSPTYVFQAQTAGDGAARRYVTVVAQPDGAGELQPALKSVTDAAHLDRTPQMKLVDAVDAQASNRASLLFELREQGSRQFALYRVIGARADQIFLTGTTQ